MRFQAKVLNANMGVEFLTIDADSREEAQRFVETSGARLLQMKQQGSSWRQITRPKAFNLTVFNQQLFTLLEAGQTIVDAIDVLGKNDQRSRHRAVYRSLLQHLQQGKQLSEAMAHLPSVFPSLYVAMVRSSETTGTVKASIQRYMQYQKQADDIRSKLTSAAIYPAVLVAVGFVVIAFLLLYVVPRFSVVFDDVAATKHTEPGFIQIWGSFVREHTLFAWSVVPAVIVSCVTVLFHPRTRGALFKKLLTMPWIGERVWVLQLARMYRTLSMLLRSGVSVLLAMKMTEGSLPEAMRPDLRAATLGISEGKPMSNVMTEYGLSTEVAQRLLIAGESSGNLDEMMEKIADFYDQETATWIDTAGRLIEPILMVGIGLIVGAIVLMLYSPIFDLANAI